MAATPKPDHLRGRRVKHPLDWTPTGCLSNSAFRRKASTGRLRPVASRGIGVGRGFVDVSRVFDYVEISSSKSTKRSSTKVFSALAMVACECISNDRERASRSG